MATSPPRPWGGAVLLPAGLLVLVVVMGVLGFAFRRHAGALISGIPGPSGSTMGGSPP